jgi:PAS domain-containing protein
MKIAHHLTLQIFITAALFIPFLSAGTYFVARDILETTIRQSQTELNRNVMDRIDRTLFRVMQDIRHLAGEREVEAFMMGHADADVSSQAMQDLVSDFGDNILLTGPWLEIILVDRNGRISYSSESAEIGKPFSERHPEAVSGLNAALKGDAFISEVVTAPETGQPAMIFTSPIVNERTGEIYGAMVGNYAWLVIQQMLDEIRPPVRAFLLDRTGTIIAAQADRRQDVLVRNLSAVISAGWDDRVYRNMVRLEDNAPPYLITIVPQTGRFSFHGRGWYMLMATPEPVAHQPLQGLMLSLLVISAGVVLALGIAMFILGRRVAAPIVMIKEKVQSISTGDYTRLIPDPARSPDEIRLLIDAINRMSRELRDSTVSRDYLGRIIQAMINGVIVVEPDGRIQSVNQAVLVLLKYRPEDIIGRHIAMLFAAESGGYSENDAFQMWKDRNQPTEK